MKATIKTVKGASDRLYDCLLHRSSNYAHVTSLSLRYPPMVVKPHLTTLERLLVTGVSILCVAAITLLLYRYRVPIGKWVHRVVGGYREKRRRQVFEDLDLVYGMYYKAREKDGIQSFETPYGDIYMVKPLVGSSQPVYPESFVQA